MLYILLHSFLTFSAPQQIADQLQQYTEFTRFENIAADYRPHAIITKAQEEMDQKELCQQLEELKPNLLLLLEIEQDKMRQLECWQSIENRIQTTRSQMATNYSRQVTLSSVGAKSKITSLNPIGPVANHFFSGFNFVDTKSGQVVYRTDPIDGGIAKLNLKRGEVIITFDDGPHPVRSPKILNTLKQHQVFANYFMIGKNAVRYPSIVQDISNAGNIVGSHSNTHPQLTDLSLSKAKNEIESGHKNVVASNNALDSFFFRFPYGSRNKSLVRFLKQEGIASFFWNMDSLDWKLTDPIDLLNNTITELNREQKGILLFHDVHEQTVMIMDELLTKMKQAGYTIRLAYPQEWNNNNEDI